MKLQLQFKYVFYHTANLDGRVSIPLFEDSGNNDRSVVLNDEKSIVQWLFNKNLQLMSSFLYDIFDQPNNVRVFFEIKDLFFNKTDNRGDIDLLLVDHKQPQKSISFECKRIVATKDSDGKARIRGNSPNKIRKGIIQSNRNQSLGFHKSYLMLIVLDDARYSNASNVFHRSNTEDIFDVEIPWNEKLNEEVGIVFLKIKQITDNCIDLSGGIGFRIEKQATPLDQTIETTSKILRLLESY